MWEELSAKKINVNEEIEHIKKILLKGSLSEQREETLRKQMGTLLKFKAKGVLKVAYVDYV